jgi:hypothetical protein
MFCLLMVHQPIIKEERRFGRASKLRELVAWQGTPVFLIESVGWKEIDILWVMDRTSREG